MRKLLKFEFRKLLHSKSFYICLAIMLFMIFIVAQSNQSAFEFSLQENGIVHTDEVAAEVGKEARCDGVGAMLMAVYSSEYILIAGIFVAIFICDDYSQSILKNIYSKGYSRNKVILSKLLTILIATSAMYILVCLYAFILGASYFGVGEGGAKIFVKMLVQYISCIANVSFAFAISSWIRKKGASITIIVFAALIISLILSLIDKIIWAGQSNHATNLYFYSFPTELAELDVLGKRVVFILFASLIYTALFVFWSFFSNRKNEI